MSYGICVECKVRDSDSSEKELYQCPYCGRYFCVEHFEPKPVHIRDYSLYSKYPEFWVAMQKEIEVEGKHPCFQFTKKWVEEKDQELQLQKKLLMHWLDKSKAYRPRHRHPPPPYYSHKPRTPRTPRKRIIRNVTIFALIIILIGGVYHHRAFVIPTFLKFIGYEAPEISPTPIQTPATTPVQTPTLTPTPTPTPMSTLTPMPTPTPTFISIKNIEKLEHDVVELVNAIRNERGSTPLIWDSELYIYSKQHSENMARQGYMFHSSIYAPYAENAWWGYGTRWTANDIVESWMSSPKHKTWLICPHLKHIAVGIAISNTGMYASWTFWRNETQYEDWWYAIGTDPPDWWY